MDEQLVVDILKRIIPLAIVVLIFTLIGWIIISTTTRKENELRERIKQGQILTPKLCQERCGELPVALYTPGFVLVKDEHGLEEVCYAATNSCFSFHERACTCGVGSALLNNQ